MPLAMRMPTKSDGTACGRRSLKRICAGDALCIRKRCTRFSSTLIRPCVVLAMIGASEMMNATSVTEAVPAPTHIRISGAIATIGTVCSSIV